MGWAENVDGVLVGMGVQEVTVGLEAEQEVEEGDGEQAEVVVQGVAGVVKEGLQWEQVMMGTGAQSGGGAEQGAEKGAGLDAGQSADQGLQRGEGMGVWVDGLGLPGEAVQGGSLRLRGWGLR